ncbi:MAG: hypothetical protein IT306_27495 [Chloroflexi bacterium]|nr:hypothetical protein [Chloroflexota bacterium]
MQRTHGKSIVVGVFDDRVDAEHALMALREEGLSPTQIDVAVLETPESTAVTRAPTERRATRVDETSGILAGGLLGGVAGWLLAASTVAVPGLGALVAAGALVGALGGAGIGAATGGLIGYLIDHGLHHAEASYYHERVSHGAAVVIVRDATGRESEVRELLQRHHGHDYHTRPGR